MKTMSKVMQIPILIMFIFVTGFSSSPLNEFKLKTVCCLESKMSLN